MKLTEKQVSIIKTTFIIMFAVGAGDRARSIITALQIAPFISRFLYLFFLLIFVLISQWILWSDRLPKWWMLNGFVGCLISSALASKLPDLFTFNSAYPIDKGIDIEGVLQYLFMGIIVAIPQGLLLKKKGYLWVLLNGVGWALNNVYVVMLAYSVFSKFPAYVNLLMVSTDGILLGLLLSPYLYSILNDEGLNQMKLAD